MAGRIAVLTMRSAAVAVGLAACGFLAGLAPVANLIGRDDKAGRTSGGGDDVTVGSVADREHTRDLPGGPRGAVPPMRRVDCRTKKCVALTFDDGPVSSTTRLLDTLAANGARATFFLVGRNVEAFPEVARREAMEGHELGNHSFSHPNLREASTRRGTSQLRRTQQAIRRAAGVTPVLMRPPYGATDKRVASIAKRLRLAQVLWSLDTIDWQVRESKKVERKVVAGTRNGSIVLMHDIHPTTVAAVPGILERLAAKGYHFVTVSELFGKPLVPGKTYTERCDEAGTPC